jgi:type IV pilus assembly protein PilM
MALSFLKNGSRKRDQVVAIDIGSRTTKAVVLERRNSKTVLCGYSVMDAPVYEKNLSIELLSEHLKQVAQSMLGFKSKTISLTVGVNDALMRPIEMPVMPIEDMRLVLKHNSRNYLQHDLAGYLFDCHVVRPMDKPAPTGKDPAKQKILVAGAKQTLVDDYLNAARGAGLVADRILPGLIGPVNAFESAMPQVFANEVVALIDLGFKNSSICILEKGELVLTRTVGIGGDRLTTSLSESMKISYAEAEGIKIGMAHEVQSAIETTMMPLGRELRASIDFYEHQNDKAVAKVFVSGGSSRSPIVLQALQTELMLECQTWNPANSIEVELPSELLAEVEQVCPNLAVALGAALASF